MRISFRLPMTAAGVALASCLATSALAQSFVMKFGTATVNDPQHEYIKIYKEEIEQRSGGRIKVEIYPQSQLGPIPRQLEGLQLGTIEGFIGPADFYVGVDKRFGVFSAPILFRDMTNAAATLADPELNQAILALGSDKGYVGLGTFAYAQHDYMAKDPIRTFADFKGKKIRVNATPLEREAMARLGATASPMPLNEVLPALQRNVIDGTRSGLSVFVTLKYQDVSKVVTVTNDTMLVPLATASKVWFDKLPADLQKAVTDAGRAAQVRNQKFTLDFNAQMPKRWAEVGGELFVLPDAERQKLVAALKTVGDDVTKDDPPVKAFFERVRAAAAKH
ncbi:MAG TPA: TRAP transporter substrate-binding protein [Xanthobacteraceae bacterium]|jgi:TRAP-type C4-dicarboxylate transport system substrate-binding protein|nr:TRAP transporter substrate-binding protein [Xanthobacteraceae bacterium]